MNKFHDDVKLLGITFDNELKFDFRFNVLKICSKASRKFSVLAEIQNFWQSKEHGQTLTPILWHIQWATLKQPWKGAKLWWPKSKPVAISLINMLKSNKRTSSMVTWLRNNKCWNSVLKLWLPLLMWLPQPGDFKWL